MPQDRRTEIQCFLPVNGSIMGCIPQGPSWGSKLDIVWPIPVVHSFIHVRELACGFTEEGEI
jgi:hypothetical protein